MPEQRAMANLRTALWRLRRPGSAVIEARGENLWLAPEVAVDLREFTSVAREVIDGTGPADDAHADLMTGGGELLGDWYDDWVLIERERLHQLRLYALEALAERLTAAGRFARAAESARAAVAAEPLRESAHRVLIQVHLAQGNRGEALCQFDVYRRIMRDELDLEPSADVARLVAPLVERTARRLSTAL
jgi:DNA-binding SARP family transcriptional activator